LAINRLNKEYGIPPGAHDHHTDEETEIENVRLDIEQTRYDIRAGIHPDFSAIDNLRWFFTYSDYSHEELEGEEIGTQWSNDGWENRFELLHAPILGWHGVLGLQIKQSQVAAVGDESFIPKTDTSHYGLFIVEDFHTDDWSYEIGARIDRSDLEPDSSSNDKSYTNTSLSASALWQINSRWSVGISLSQSERAPVIEELYSNEGNSPGNYVEHAATKVIEIGDSDLKSEQANNLDLTLNYNSDRVTSYITIFFNDFNDYIYLDNTRTQQDETYILQYSQEDAQFSGIEFEATLALGSAFGGEFTLTAFGDQMTGELDTAGDAPRLPPQRLGSRLEYSQGGLSTYLAVIKASDQDKPGVHEEETDAYTRWDAGINYRIDGKKHREYLSFIRFKNISNEEIRNSTSFLRDIAPEAGRSLEVGFRYSF